MYVFLISPVPIAEPLTSELIDTPVFYNLAPRPIKYRVSVPIPMYNAPNVKSVCLCERCWISHITMCAAIAHLNWLIRLIPYKPMFKDKLKFVMLINS